LNADINWDGVVFISAAKKYTFSGLSEALGTWVKFPLYPFLISIVQKFVSNWVISGRLISLFSILIITIGLYNITRDLFDHKAAFFSSMIFALFPESLIQSNSVNRDPCFLAVFIWAVYYLQKAIETRRILHFISGLFLILFSGMFRAEGLIIWPIYTCFLIAMAIKNQSNRRKYVFLLSLWVFIPICIIFLSYFLINSNTMFQNHFSRWINTFAVDINPLIFFDNYNWIYSNLQQMNDLKLHSVIGVHFFGVAQRIIPLIFLFGILKMLSQIILIVNVLPVFYGIWHSPWKNRHVFIFFSALGYLGFLYGYFIWYDLMLARWLFPVAVMICPWIGFGIIEFLETLRKLPCSKIAIILFFLILIITAVTEFDKYFKKKDDLARITGTWISGQANFEKTTIVFNNPVVAFYTGREVYFSKQGDTILYLNSDDKTYSKIENFALENRADLMVLYLRIDKLNMIVPFLNFVKIKEFSDENRTAIVYCSVKK
jgi:4-amino-4-deoxy-L-arabinose transferase-like glycosyltransferase